MAIKNWDDMISKRFQTNIFLGIGFLMGCINLLYSEFFYICILIALMINLKGNWKLFLHNVRQEWKYIILPIVGVLYLVLHYFISLLLGVKGKPYWSFVELLILYFFVFSLYFISIKPFLTSNVLKKFLLSLCVGIMVINTVKFFYLTGLGVFTDPANTLKEIYAQRFGMNMGFWGGYFYLEPQACYLCVSSLISMFFLMNEAWIVQNRKQLLFYSLILFFSLLFLSFTVTKGAILGVVLGFLVLIILAWRKWSRTRKITFILTVSLSLLTVIPILPEMYFYRYRELADEIEAMKEGELKVGSFSGRILLLKANFIHFKQFGLYGFGVYKKSIIKNWYEKYPGNTHAHNSFVEYWITGGICGLMFLIYYFVAPLLRMRKLHKYSPLGIAIIVSLIFMNNTTILIILVDSAPFIIAMLALLFFYTDKFYELDTSNHILSEEEHGR